LTNIKGGGGRDGRYIKGALTIFGEYVGVVTIWKVTMYFYLLLLLGWFGVATAAAVLMGRFIAAGRGELGRDDERRVSRETLAGRRTGSPDAARPDRREAA
jgi:hypothetical protein